MAIQNFKSALIGGGVRPNQFRVILTFPNWVPLGAAAVLKSGFLVTAASLPPSTISTTSVMYRGRNIPYAGERQFTPWSVNVLNDTDFVIRNALEAWQQGINSNTDNTGRIASNQYQVNAIVQQLDRNDNILKQYEMIDIYPSNVGEIALDFGNNDVIESFPVVFEYTYWTSNVTSQTGALGLAAGVGFSNILGNLPTTGI